MWNLKFNLIIMIIINSILSPQNQISTHTHTHTHGEVPETCETDNNNMLYKYTREKIIRL